MKIIVCSDVHGRAEYLDALLAMYPTADGFVFLGDGARDFEYAPQRPTQFHLCVSGNCDYGCMGPQRLVQEFGGVKTLITHGHLYGVKSSLSGIAAAAENAGCTLALYGHTHKSRVEWVDGVTLVCPGALKNGEYAVLSISGGAVQAVLKTL